VERSVVVVGGGFAGVIAARYLKRWNPALRVTLVEPAAQFISCPMSNRVLAGTLSLTDLARDYGRLGRHGIQLVRDEAVAIDPQRARCGRRGCPIPFEPLRVAPGVDFLSETPCPA